MSKLVHWEIPSTDVKRSADFYAELFGWQMRGWSDDYMLFVAEDDTGGGISKVDVMPGHGIEVYISVDDIEATLRRAEALGGRSALPKSEIGDGMGFTAAFEDPCGCRIGLWSQS